MAVEDRDPEVPVGDSGRGIYIFGLMLLVADFVFWFLYPRSEYSGYPANVAAIIVLIIAISLIGWGRDRMRRRDRSTLQPNEIDQIRKDRDAA